MPQAVDVRRNKYQTKNFTITTPLYFDSEITVAEPITHADAAPSNIKLFFPLISPNPIPQKDATSPGPAAIRGNEMDMLNRAFAKNQQICAMAHMVPAANVGRMSSGKRTGLFFIAMQYTTKNSVVATRIPEKWAAGEGRGGMGLDRAAN